MRTTTTKTSIFRTVRIVLPFGICLLTAVLFTGWRNRSRAEEAKTQKEAVLRFHRPTSKPTAAPTTKLIDSTPTRAPTIVAAHLANLVKAQSMIDPHATEETYAPEMDMTMELLPSKPWHGPWPDSLKDLPDTDVVRSQVAKFPYPKELDQQLSFLGKLRRCVDPKVKTTGGVFIELQFVVDQTTGMAHGTRVDMMQSTLSREDDDLFLACAETAFKGTEYQVEKEEGAFPERWVWRNTVSVPVGNDRLYASLFGEIPGTSANATIR